MFLKQSTVRNIAFFMSSSTDSITGKTGLTPTVTLSKDGAAFGAAAGSVTEIANGWYYLAATTADTGTLGDLLLHATGTGADNCDDKYLVCLDLPGNTVSSVTGAVGSVTAAVTTTDTANVTSIKAKTDNLPSDPADASDIAASFSTVNGTLSTIAGYIDTEVAAIKAKTDNLPAIPASQGDVTTVGTAVATVATYVDTEVAAIKAKTDNLPSDPADASDIAAAFSTVNGTLSTIAGYIDTEVAAIKAKTDNLPATPASQGDVTSLGSDISAIKAKTDNLPSDPADESILLAAISGITASVDLTPVQTVVDDIKAILYRDDITVVGPTKVLTYGSNFITWNVDETLAGSFVYEIKDRSQLNILIPATADATNGDHLYFEPQSGGRGFYIIIAIDGVELPITGGWVAGGTTHEYYRWIYVHIVTGGTAAENTRALQVALMADDIWNRNGMYAVNDGLRGIHEGLPPKPTIRKNTQTVFTFMMYDTSGNPATGLTVTSQRAVNGVLLEATENSVTEISDGLYRIVLSANDTNGDTVAYLFTATGARPLPVTMVMS